MAHSEVVDGTRTEEHAMDGLLKRAGRCAGRKTSQGLLWKEGEQKSTQGMAREEL